MAPRSHASPLVVPTYSACSVVAQPGANLRHLEAGLVRVNRICTPALIGVCLALAGCTTSGGVANRDDRSSSAATANSAATPAPVQAAGIDEKLLKPSELAGIVGATDMNTDRLIQKPLVQTRGFDPADCAALAAATATFSYYAPGQAAMAGNSNTGARGEAVSQLITVWQDHKQSRMVVAQSSYEWRYCPSGKPFTFTAEDGTATHWVPGDVTTDGEDRISSSIRRQERPQRSCGHVMASQANVVVEAVACGDGNTAEQASEIANRIAAEFPQ
jgi:hypothetical protein